MSEGLPEDLESSLGMFLHQQIERHDLESVIDALDFYIHQLELRLNRLLVSQTG